MTLAGCNRFNEKLYISAEKDNQDAEFLEQTKETSFISKTKKIKTTTTTTTNNNSMHTQRNPVVQREGRRNSLIKAPTREDSCNGSNLSVPLRWKRKH